MPERDPLRSQGDFVIDVESSDQPGPYQFYSTRFNTPFQSTKSGDFVVRTGETERFRIANNGTVTGLTGLPFQQPLGIFNVKDAAYGAKGDGVTNDTAPIQAAIDAAGASSGRVFFPAGRYLVDSITVTKPVTLVFAGQASTTLVASAAVTGTLLNISLTSSGVVSAHGGVVIDMTNAGGAAVAVNLNNLAGVEWFGDVTIAANKGVGFQISNSNGCHFQRLSVTNGTKGISVNGDNAAELYWTECDITNQSGTMAAAVEIDRAATADVGGHYFHQLRITRSGGTITNGILCANTSGAVDFSPLFIRNSVIDNINGGSAISIKQKKNVMIVGSWATHPAGNANAVVLADGCQQFGIGGGTFILGASGGIGIDLANGCQNVILDGLTIDGATNAIGLLTGVAVSGLVLGTLLVTASNLTNSMSRLGAGAAGATMNGLGVVTSGAGGGSQCFEIVDAAGGGNKFLRMDGSSNLQVLNSAFSATIMQLSDGGQLIASGGMSPGNFGSMATGNKLWQGSGAPSNASGANGDFYFRIDTPGTANQRIYVKSAGSWVGIV